MKITIFNWRDIFHRQGGGAEAYIHEQGKRWVEQGHEVTLCTARVKDRPAQETVDGINIIRRGGKFTVYPLSLLYFLRAPRPDVIIDVENGIPFFTPLCTRVPVVLVIHHIHDRVWNKEFPGWAAVIGRFLEMKVMPRVYRRRRIVTVSNSSKEEIEQIFPGADIHIVHNGVRSECVPGPKAESPEVVFVGRLKRYKRIDLLLEALSFLKTNDVRTYIVGRGDDEARLKAYRNELGLKSVHFLGHISEEEKVRILQRAWIAVNPSMIEGWSITNIEANACGTPVVGSNVPGIRDSIRHERTGLLFENGARELAEKMDFLMTQKDLREKMSEAAVTWSQNFSWEKSAGKFMALLEQEIQS